MQLPWPGQSDCSSSCFASADRLSRFCCILNAVSIDLTWILTILGVLVGGAALPVGLVLVWPQMSLFATVASPWISLCFGLVAWFVVTKLRSGSVTVATTGDPLNAVAGNITSLMTGLICSVVLSYVFPAKFTSTDPRAIARAEKINGTTPAQTPITDLGMEKVVSGQGSVSALQKENTEPDHAKSSSHVVAERNQATTAPATNGLVDFLETSYTEPMDAEAVRVATRLALSFNAVFIVVAVLLVPFTLFGSSWIFSRAGFKGWCVVSFVWVWVGMVICVLWPLHESRKTIIKIAKGIIRDVGCGGGHREQASAA